MAFGTPQWGVGATSGGVTSFVRQPNTDFEPLLTGRRGVRGGGEVVNGLDGEILRWGGGNRGSLSDDQFQALVNLWATIAVPNRGRVYYRRYNYETGAWQVVRAIMTRPRSRPQGTDGTGPRHFDVEIRFRALGIP